MEEQFARQFGPATENIVNKLREIAAECKDVEGLPDFKRFNIADREAFINLAVFINNMAITLENYRTARGYFEREKKTDNVIYANFECN